jgi:hypothetical protein
VYLTFDIDCLDPAFAPGTGTPVCGGLSTVQALEILGGLRGINLVGMDVINLGNPNEFRIVELAEAVIELTGSRSKIVTRPLPHDDPRQRQPDITKARTLLDWHPTVQLHQGLAKTIAYFEALLRDETAAPAGQTVHELQARIAAAG